MARLVTRTVGLFGLAALLWALPAVAAPPLRGLPLTNAISILEDQGLTVLYSSDLVKPRMRVKEEPTGGSPRAQLDQMLASFDLRTRLGPAGAVLIVAAPTAGGAAAGHGSILGLVREPVRGALIDGAELVLDGASSRRTTAAGGRFSFDAVPPGSYTLRVRHPAYRWESAEEIQVQPRQPTVAMLELGIPAVAQLENVTVGASQYELLRAVGASQSLLTGTMLEELPDVGDDALRAVKRLPGTTQGGLSAQTNVRGGELSETLVRFDNLRLFNPFHLKDFQSVFSAIDPRVVSSIDVYTGGFPVMFGDRMSSVIDVATLAPPATRYHELSMSFFNTSVLSSGLVDNGRGEWLASLRRSNLDVWFDRLDALPGKPSYMDGFAKFGYDVSDALRITGNVLHFADNITLNDSDVEEQASADYRDSYVWLRLDHRLGGRFAGATLVAHSQLDSRRQGVTDQPGVSRGFVDDQRDFQITSLQSDWRWHDGDKLALNFGAELRRMQASYQYADAAEFAVLFNAPGASMEASRQRTVNVRPRGEQYALYASARHATTQRLTLEAGLRWDRQTLDPGSDNQFSPRLGARWALGKQTYLRASWGRFIQSQAIDELQVEDGLTTYAAPQRADHTVIGLEHRFSSGIDLRVEAYTKQMDILRPRYENLLNTFVILPELKPDRIRIAPDSARARGFEILLSRRNAAPFSWWLGYSWSTVDDRVAGVDVPRSWDQSHAVSAGVSWDTPTWNIGLGLLHRSGWPTTPVTFDDSGSLPVARAGARNSGKLNSYRSLDIRVARRFEFQTSTLSVFLEVDNATGRSNPCCIEYEFDPAEGGLELESTKYFPPVPSLGFVWQF